MNLRSFDLCVAALLVPVALLAQNPVPPAIATAPPASPQAEPAPAPKPKSTAPDYPDPRTFTVGVFYWLTIPGTGPDVIGGLQATGFSTLNHFGKDHFTPGLEISYPITRTGELHLEGFESKGDGNQTAPADTTIFATGYGKGAYLATQYQITGAKFYLEDLLHPFKFPVAKFRLKSLWEVQYVGIRTVVDAPLSTTSTSTGTLVATAVSGSRNVLLPTFGLAAEYAVSPHVLLRGAATGFGLPHRAELWDAEGTISYRRSKSWEIRAGFKIMHVKTSPQKDEYITDTISGGFVGLRYHWN